MTPLIFHVRPIDVNDDMKAHTFPRSVVIARGVLRLHITSSILRQRILLGPSSHMHIDPGKPPKQAQTTKRERECGSPIRRASPGRRLVTPPPRSHHRSPTSPAPSRTGAGSSTFSYPTASPTSYSVAELWTLRCKRLRKMPLSVLHKSRLIGLFYQTEGD